MLRGLFCDVEHRGLQPDEHERGSGEEGAVGAGDEEQVGVPRRGLSGSLRLLRSCCGGDEVAVAAATATAAFALSRRDDFQRGRRGHRSSGGGVSLLPTFSGGEDKGGAFCFLRGREQKGM